VKDKKSAFTLVELLAVLGIIAILVALLIPALTKVRNMAKETQQKAQLTTIEMGLTAFRNDYGDYPPSHGYDSGGNIDYTYCGAQTLAEALVGWDLMGFHPNSAWRADGKDKNDGDTAYTGATTGSQADKERNLKERKGPYLDVATANAFRLGDLFANASSLSSDAPSTFVICDVFGVKSVTIGGKTVKAGVPILYYKANTSSKTIDTSIGYWYDALIYDRSDNIRFVSSVKEPADVAKYPGYPTPLNPLTNTAFFYKYITDPKVTATPWPSRPDSYILISAGADGFYGTRDDICNFDPNS
jgi:prepilin-type N-terminal cleavage/methylation domain-containing protein